MARKLIKIPRTEEPIVKSDGTITHEWQQQLEEALDIIQKLADALDAATGSSTGSTVDSEWNALVNAIKQDT